MAISSGTISGISAGISDIFAASADKSKAQFDRIEGQEYTLASQLATKNEQFTQMSTAIKEAQTSREVSKSLGATSAAVAGAGFAESGSALDILRESASQGALTKAVTAEQGLVTEAGYNEQAQSYNLMATAADQAAAAEDKAAKESSFLGYAGIASSVLLGSDVGNLIAGAGSSSGSDVVGKSGGVG